MAELSQIKMPNNTTYDLKDATARQELLSKQDLIQIDPAGSVVPDNGEIIVDNGAIKIGDGETTVSDLTSIGGVEVIRL